MTETKDLVILGQYAIVSSGIDIAEAVKANLNGERISFRNLDTAKLPSQRGTKFTIPNDSGEDIETSEITGIIIHIGKQRIYYAKSFEESGGGEPPDCMSWDMVRGIGTPGGECEVCPLNEFPQDGGSKPCKEKNLIFLLRPTDFLPMFIPAGVGSIDKVKDYRVSLLLKNIPMHSIETTFSLITEKNKKGIQYPQLKMSAGRRLSPQEVEVIRSYREDIMPFISSDFAHFVTSAESQAAEDTSKEKIVEDAVA